jgi:AcrR family transcriptional regulator
MVKKPIDRRVARTREMLHRALMSLIIEKGYEAISVEDICERANVGRSTFYGHFTSKDDLKRRHLELLRQTLLDQHRSTSVSARAGTRPLGFGLAMFEHAREHLPLYRALVGSKDGAIALDTIRQTLCDFVREELPSTEAFSSDDVPRELIVQHIVGAYMAALTWWLNGGARLPPQRMNEFFHRLMSKDIARS